MHTSRGATAVLIATALLAAGCAGKASGSASGAVKVTASDKTCTVSASTVKAGRQTFAVTNKGGDITEAYVYASGDRVMGEVENIGPGLERDLTVDLVPGSYQVACKPGMVGNGIRQNLTVTGTAVKAAPMGQQLQTAVSSYRTYVETEVAALVSSTAPFVAAVKAGDVAKAETLYAAPRTHYERIEPIAESFGDLDPLIDERIDDVTAGQQFVGFHRIEQDLWQKKDISKDGAVADQLLANVKKLQGLIPTVSITPLTMANGAKSLLDEVAKSKVTGEEERYSHLDLTDFAANVDGSRYAYTELRPAIATSDKALATTLDSRFSSIQAALAQHAAPAADAIRTGAPYALYTTLSAAQVKALAVQVDALSEPLGQLAAALPQS
jgi:iron uptake system component EfeO